ncbi:MAG: EpsG family protein [Prevotella sp.]|nr:EpsG family protein [Prevotella sp.]
MAVIFLYFALFLGVHFLSKQFKRPGAAKLFQLVACFILLFGFFGFRDITVLNDTSHYYGFYYQKAHVLNYRNEPVTTFHLLDSFEYGFQVFIHILIKYVSKEPYTIIWFSSFVLTIGELWFINKYTHDIAKVCFYMLIAGLFFTHYCIIRQALALLFFYMAFVCFEKGKILKYYLLILCACLFHLSAIFLLFLPIIIRTRPTKRNAFIAIGLSLLFTMTIFEILALLGLREHPYYQAAVQKEALSLVGLADCALMIFVLFVCIFIRKRSNAPTPSSTYFWIGVIGFCISLVALVLYPIARINEYLWPLILIHLLRYIDPNAMKTPYTQRVEGTRNLIRLFVIAVFLIKLIGINTFRPEWLHIEPYQFYDFSKKDHTYNLYPLK